MIIFLLLGLECRNPFPLEKYKWLNDIIIQGLQALKRDLQGESKTSTTDFEPNKKSLFDYFTKLIYMCKLKEYCDMFSSSHLNRLLS